MNQLQEIALVHNTKHNLLHFERTPIDLRLVNFTCRHLELSTHRLGLLLPMHPSHQSQLPRRQIIKERQMQFSLAFLKATLRRGGTQRAPTFQASAQSWKHSLWAKQEQLRWRKEFRSLSLAGILAKLPGKSDEESQKGFLTTGPRLKLRVKPAGMRAMSALLSTEPGHSAIPWAVRIEDSMETVIANLRLARNGRGKSFFGSRSIVDMQAARQAPKPRTGLEKPKHRLWARRSIRSTARVVSRELPQSVQRRGS